ncbi:MAG: hypothetical protein ABI759_05340 [Candidatus Solibacter sp.]
MKRSLAHARASVVTVSDLYRGLLGCASVVQIAGGGLILRLALRGVAA